MENSVSIHIGSIEAKENATIVVANNVNSPVAGNTKDACLRSLAFRDMGNRFDDINPAFKGTCEWLLQHDTYERWAVCDRGGLLWIRGKPGSGKSTLLKYALDNHKAGHDDLVLSFFFHGRGVELQRTPLGFFRSLIHQVLRTAPDILPDLISTFEERCKESGEPGRKWQWHQRELQKYFELSLLKVLEVSSVWLFVDALDECGKGNAVELFQWLKTLPQKPSSTTSKQLRICITCRHYPILDQYHEFGICAEKENEEDITTYVQGELFYSPKLAGSPVPSLIFSHASGVFMWARLVVTRVRELEREGASLKNIEKAVRSVPTELDELYQELTRHMDKESMKLVQWVCFATRPLSVDELQWAMVIEADCPFQSLRECQDAEGYMSDGGEKETQIAVLTCGLAEITTPASGTRVVQFIHQSVRDFFIKKGFLSGDSTSIDAVIGMAHHRLSQICLRYLAMEEIGQSTNYREDFPFLAYAATSWAAHAKECDSRGVVLDDLLELFAWPSSDNLVKRWASIYRQLGPFYYRFPSDGASLVHILSWYGVRGLLQAALERVDTKGGTSWWAFFKPRPATGNLGVDWRDSAGRTPLSWATAEGHEAVVKFLLATGKVDINSRDGDGQTPLLWAAKNGYEAVAELLLATGKADIDLGDASSQTPLSWAARKGHEAIARLLIATGKVDIDSMDIGGRTPLLNAASSGHDAIVKLLLATGKINISQKMLSLAAGMGHEAVIKLLLATGKVDIDLEDRDGNTPASHAAGSGHAGVIKLLLANGKVDIDSRSKRGRTLLSWAAENGHTAVIKLLLATGKVNIESKDIDGCTPLSWAAGEGHEDAVKLLLATGKVDINSKDEHGRTPLSWAAENGNPAVVKVLLATGKVDIDSRDRGGPTSPSWGAVEGGYEASGKLELGPDKIYIDLMKLRGRTPLSWAAEKGHEDVVKLLLATGKVDINSTDSCNRTPLAWAAAEGHEAVVKLLELAR